MATVVCCVLNLIQIQHLVQPVKVGVMRHVVRKVSLGAIGFRSAVLCIMGKIVNIRLCVMTGIIKAQTVYAANYATWGLQHCVQAVG